LKTPRRKTKSRNHQNAHRDENLKKHLAQKKNGVYLPTYNRKFINMYAIVEIAGHQYKVQKDQQIYVNRLQDAEGSKVTFDKVLLTDDGKNVTVGAPAVAGVKITASVVQHLKGDKVIVFKKKRRKGYQKKNGFRAYLTELKIENIG
jgi:large subunit ribosomal protein L21